MKELKVILFDLPFETKQPQNEVWLKTDYIMSEKVKLKKLKKIRFMKSKTGALTNNRQNINITNILDGVWHEKKMFA